MVLQVHNIDVQTLFADASLTTFSGGVGAFFSNSRWVDLAHLIFQLSHPVEFRAFLLLLPVQLLPEQHPLDLR